MVEAAPSPSFKMSQPDLLLEFLRQCAIADVAGGCDDQCRLPIDKRTPDEPSAKSAITAKGWFSACRPSRAAIMSYRQFLLLPRRGCTSAAERQCPSALRTYLKPSNSSVPAAWASIRLFCASSQAEFYWHSEFSDELGELPDDIEDSEKYVPIPDKRELDLGKPLVLDFARQFLPNDIDEVRRIFTRKGAYARFKDLLDRRGALDHWYDFEAKVEEKALRMWCDLNSIEVGD